MDHQDDIQLIAEVEELLPRELRTRYSLRNESARPLYLFCLLPDRYEQLSSPPQAGLTDALAPTCYVGQQTALFFQGHIDRPAPESGEDRNYYFTPTPMAVEIQPGSSHRATIRTPLPISEWWELGGLQYDHRYLIERAVYRIRVELEYAYGDAETNIIAVDDEPGAFHLQGATRHRIQTDVDVFGMDLSIMVRHSDPFIRFRPIEDDENAESSAL